MDASSDFKQKYSRIFILVTMLFSAVFSHARADIKLSFGLYTSDKPTTLVKKFRPILNSLEKTMSASLKKKVSIKLNIATTYEKGVSALVNGDVDFARLGPASYIHAYQQNPNISLLAMETKKGKKSFKGVICVHKDSTIKSINQLKGKRFAFGNKNSTIGRYLSQQYLVKHGINARDLASYSYLGRHDKVGYSVAYKQYDAGALKKSTFKRLIKKGLPLKIIASFNNVTKPWVARANLNENIMTSLQAALLNLKDKKILNVLKKDGFATATMNDYSEIKDSIKNNNKFFIK